jgi:hypothetical protein
MPSYLGLSGKKNILLGLFDPEGESTMILSKCWEPLTQ